MLIVISDAFDQSLPEKLSRFGEVTGDRGRLSEADVVLVRSKTKCTKEFIDAAPRLKLIIRGGVGLDNIDRAYAESKGIEVHNTPRASAVAVAELAFALMITVASRIIEAHNGMAAGKWLKKELKRTELMGKTLCCVGVGNIASELAVRAKAFGMKVTGYRQSHRPWEHGDLKASLEEAVAGADYVSLHTPLTDSTCDMICTDIIGFMKDGAVLVNTGRGGCVDVEATAAALESGKLRAYATDVWPSDPPPEDYPLLHAPHVVMIPHLGASTKENLLRIGEEVESILSRFTGQV